MDRYRERESEEVGSEELNKAVNAFMYRYILKKEGKKKILV